MISASVNSLSPATVKVLNQSVAGIGPIFGHVRGYFDTKQTIRDKFVPFSAVTFAAFASLSLRARAQNARRHHGSRASSRATTRDSDPCSHFLVSGARTREIGRLHRRGGSLMPLRHDSCGVTLCQHVTSDVTIPATNTVNGDSQCQRRDQGTSRVVLLL